MWHGAHCLMQLVKSQPLWQRHSGSNRLCDQSFLIMAVIMVRRLESARWPGLPVDIWVSMSTVWVSYIEFLLIFWLIDLNGIY